MQIPTEIYEEIISYTDIETAIRLKCEYAIRKLHNKNTYNCAAKNGQLHVIKWLHQNGMIGDIEIATQLATKNGHFDVVKYLCEQLSEIDAFMLCECYILSSLDNIKGLCEIGLPQTIYKEDLILNTAAAGQLDIVRYLHEKYPDIPLLGTILWYAAENGQLDVVKYIYECRTMYDLVSVQCNISIAIEYATSARQIEVVQFLETKRPTSWDIVVIILSILLVNFIFFPLCNRILDYALPN